MTGERGEAMIKHHTHLLHRRWYNCRAESTQHRITCVQSCWWHTDSEFVAWELLKPTCHRRLRRF
jgi:hypothetical protein